MKKSFRTLIAIVVVLMMVFSLSSCSIFQAMRDAQNNVEETTIYADPAENEMISTFNNIPMRTDYKNTGANRSS